jgi:hypothetical protein
MVAIFHIHVIAQPYVEERIPPYLSSLTWANLYQGNPNTIHILGLADSLILATPNESGFHLLFYAKKDSLNLTQPVGIPDTGTYLSFMFGGDYYSFNSDMAVDQNDNVYISYSKQRVYWSDLPPPRFLKPRIRVLRKLATGFENTFEIDGGLNPRVVAGHNSAVYFVWESVTPNRSDSNYYFYKSGIYYRLRSPSGILNNPQLIDSGFSPQIAIDDQDTIHLVWLKADSSSSLIFSLRYARCLGGTAYPPVTLKDSISTPIGLSCLVDNTSAVHVGWTEKRSYPQMKFFHLKSMGSSVRVDSSLSYSSWGGWARFAVSPNNQVHAAWPVYENGSRWAVYYSSEASPPLFSTVRVFRSMYYADPLFLFVSPSGVAKSVLSNNGVKYLKNMQNGPDSLVSGPSPGYIRSDGSKPAILDNRDRVWVAYAKNQPGNPYDYEIWLLRFLEETSNAGEARTTILRFFLAQNYPNPFNPATTIKFVIPQAGFVSLKVFDILGKEVAMLVDEEMVRGEHKVTLDASGLSSGVYFYRLSTGGFMQTRKLVLLR